MAEPTTERIGPEPFIAVDHMGEGPLVLFMHGIGGNRTNWRDQLPVFAADFHAVAWDARGYGGSDDYDGPLDFGSFGADVVRVLDHFGAEQAHLVGLSMGGRIAQDVCARWPERVASMVLCDTFPGFITMDPKKREEFVRLRKKPLVEEGKEPRDIAPVVARTLVGPNASEAAFQRLVDSMSALHKESYIKTIEASAAYDRSADLESIAVPTLLVYGADDALTTPGIGRAMHEKITGSEFEIIADAGHLVNLEQPEAFNRIALGFLRRHAGARQAAQ